MKRGNFWYCPHCRKEPDVVIERYLEPVEEIKIWNPVTEWYELEESNIDRIGFERLCGECRTILEYKEVE